MGLRAYMRQLPERKPSTPVNVPAPMGSINTISSGAAMPPEDCILRYNLIPAEYGLRTRLGSREWCTGLDGPVRSIFSFAAKDSASNKAFATTQTGIWDVTSSSASPTQSVVFGTQDTTSGHGVSCVMVNSSSGHHLLVADEANGLQAYSETTATWSTPAITGVDPADVCFVTIFKRRVFLVEKGTGNGYYLDVNAVAGAATAYNFGAHFPHGGELVGLWSLTYDGGAGMDDSLVAVSRGGDVLVYQGTLTTASDFVLRGVYYAGAVPAGRRVCSDFGGDLLLMTTTGLVSIRQLTTGSSTQWATEKIANLWNKLMLTRSSLLGWSMALHPQDATLIVVAPVGASVASEQLVMSVQSRVWSQYRNLGMGLCATAHEGLLYFGTADGKVKIMSGYVDGVTLTDPSAYDPIEFSLLTSFQDLGTPRKKRLNLVEPVFASDTSVPQYQVQARFDFDQTEADTPTDAVTAGANTWDTGAWDSAVWGGDYMVTQSVDGLVGLGRRVALAVKGNATSRTVIVGFMVNYDEVGLL